MTVRFLRAEELARFAGVAKSTVLAAIRRGEIPSSRTAGRGTRISLETARSYLAGRGCPIPIELREPRASAIAVVTESEETVARVRSAARGSWTVVGSAEAYGTLLWIGANAPAVVVVDLGMPHLHPFETVRALRAAPSLAQTRIVAAAADPEVLAASKRLAVADAVSLADAEALARALTRDASADAS